MDPSTELRTGKASWPSDTYNLSMALKNSKNSYYSRDGGMARIIGHTEVSGEYRQTHPYLLMGSEAKGSGYGSRGKALMNV